MSEVERFYSYFLDEVVDGVYADEGTFWVGPTDYVYVAYSDDVDRINPCSDPMASSFNLFHYCGYGNRLYMQADTIWYHYNQIGLAGITNIMVYELGNRARDADVSLADDSDRTLFPEAYIDEVTEFVVADGQLSPDGHDCKTGSLSAPCVPIELDGDTTEGSPQVTTTVPATADAPTTTEPNQAPETTIPNGSRGYFILDALLSGVCGDRPTTETEACVNECAQDFDSLAYCDDSIFIFFYDEFGSPITQADIDQAIDVYYG